MDAPLAPPRPFLPRVTQRLAALFSQQSIAVKLYTVAAVALAVIGLLGSLTAVTLQKLDTSSRRVASMYEASQQAESLLTSTLNLSHALDSVLSGEDSSLVSTILAQNETLMSDFVAYQSSAVTFNLTNDATFASENETLILNIRTNIYKAVSLHLKGDFKAAAENKQQADQNIGQLASAIERSVERRRFALSEEVANFEALRRQQLWWMLAIFTIGTVLLAGVSFGYARSIVKNLQRLIQSADAIAEGSYDHRIETKAGDETARLAAAFNDMAASVQERQARVVQQQQTIEQRALELEQVLASLRQTIGERDELTVAIRELSSPVLSLADGLLVMPLIGAIDTERAALLTHALLSAIERQKATVAIMDVTGVPVIDTQVARAILDAAQAARLLGTQTVLAGLRPELAQTIVGLGIDLTEVVTQADLQNGIRYALRQNGRTRLAGVN